MTRVGYGAGGTLSVSLSRARVWEALRAWGARVLLPQLRILATSLAAIKEEEKMFQTPTAGHLANVTEYATRKFVKCMSFEMHPHSVLSLAKYKYHPPMVWLLPQLATKMRNINFEV